MHAVYTTRLQLTSHTAQYNNCLIIKIVIYFGSPLEIIKRPIRISIHYGYVQSSLPYYLCKLLKWSKKQETGPSRLHTRSEDSDCTGFPPHVSVIPPCAKMPNAESTIVMCLARVWSSACPYAYNEYIYGMNGTESRSSQSSS